ncbi:hypothetical protein [Rhizorhabdus sp. FW153]|uniref:hypothetical protein n=1 Tax=Rhizorhabdus sp. FW153 TaxID=3400216 RepID=UPI003CF73DC9
MKHRHTHRHQQVGDKAVFRQAGVQLGRVGCQDRRQCAELVQQLVDDRAAMGQAQRLDQRF